MNARTNAKLFPLAAIYFSNPHELENLPPYDFSPIKNFDRTVTFPDGVNWTIALRN